MLASRLQVRWSSALALAVACFGLTACDSDVVFGGAGGGPGGSGQGGEPPDDTSSATNTSTTTSTETGTETETSTPTGSETETSTVTSTTTLTASPCPDGGIACCEALDQEACSYFGDACRWIDFMEFDDPNVCSGTLSPIDGCFYVDVDAYWQEKTGTRTEIGTGVGANTVMYRMLEDGTTQVGWFDYATCGIYGFMSCTGQDAPEACCDGFDKGCTTLE